MKKYYAAITVQENGKYYAYCVPFTDNDNAVSKLAINGIVAANIYGTRKRACEVVDAWNGSYKRNGVYMFSTPSF